MTVIGYESGAEADVAPLVRRAGAEPATRHEDASEFSGQLVRVDNMFQDPVGDHHCDAAVPEGQPPLSRKEDPSVDGTVLCHGRVNVGGYYQAVTPSQVRQLPAPAAEILLPLPTTCTEIHHHSLVREEGMDPAEELDGSVDPGETAGPDLWVVAHPETFDPPLRDGRRAHAGQ